MTIIESIQEIGVPLEGNIQNAVVNFSQHDVSLVAVTASKDGETHVGFGFNSIGRFAQSGILGSRIVPRVTAAAPELLCDEQGELDPAAVARAAMQNEKPGGHGDRAGAVAALELAIWDLNAKFKGESAYMTIARKAGPEVVMPIVPAYAAGGYYYEDRGLEALRAELTGYREQGYSRFKIKIGGASLEQDIARFDVAAEVAGDSKLVAVDANGRFDLETATNYLTAFQGREPAWLEEPVDPLDFQNLARIIANTDIPVATGENLFSLADTKNLIRYGGLRRGVDILQMDAGLSYGLTEYLSMKEFLTESGFSLSQLVPHGGHLINLHIVAGLGLGGCEAYPGVFQPFGGFSPGCQLVDGEVTISDAPGYGLETKPELAPFLEQVLESA